MVSLYAWHFIAGNKLRDGTEAPPDGEWLKYTGNLVMCRSGLHASRQPFDALSYAPGNTLCLVECAGEIIEEEDKLVCAERRIICRWDATELLRYFARMQALSVIHLWEKKPPDSVCDYLATGDESLKDAAGVAAGDAAEDAWVAAGVAAGDAARAAAGDAARAAAWAAAAGAAARAAAWAAAGAAARAAAGDAARVAAGAAARVAAGDAARVAARAAAREHFNFLVYECFDGPMYNIGFKGHS
jgi:hypothetical protein